MLEPFENSIVEKLDNMARKSQHDRTELSVKMTSLEPILGKLEILSVKTERLEKDMARILDIQTKNQQMLREIELTLATKVRLIEDHEKILNGNGRPGLVTDVNDLKSNKKVDKAIFSTIVAIGGVTSAVVGWAIDYITHK